MSTHSLSASLLGFRHLLFAPLEAEAPVIVTAQQLTDQLGDRVGPDTMRKALGLGELIPLEVPHPTLLKAARLLADLGMALNPAISPSSARDATARRSPVPSLTCSSTESGSGSAGRLPARPLARSHQRDRAAAPDRLAGARRRVSIHALPRDRVAIRPRARTHLPTNRLGRWDRPGMTPWRQDEFPWWPRSAPATAFTRFGHAA